MSLVIRVPDARRDTPVEVVRREAIVPCEVLTPDGTRVTTGAWPEQAVIYAKTDTLRPAVTYWDDEGGFTVRLLVGSTQMDCWLGFQAAYAVAAYSESRIIADDTAEAMDPKTFEALCSTSHAHLRAMDMITFLLDELVERQGQTVQLGLHETEVAVGPAFVAELKERFEDPSDGFWASLKRVQSPASFDISVPVVTRLRNDNPPGIARVAIYTAGDAALVPADLTHIRVRGDDQTLQIPFDRFLDAMGERTRRLAEDWLLLPEILEPADWQALLDELRPLHREGFHAEALLSLDAEANDATRVVDQAGRDGEPTPRRTDPAETPGGTHSRIPWTPIPDDEPAYEVVDVVPVDEETKPYHSAGPGASDRAAGKRSGTAKNADPVEKRLVLAAWILISALLGLGGLLLLADFL